MSESIPVFLQSDLSSSALDRMAGAPWEFIQTFGANSLAHMAIGTIAAYLAARYVRWETRNEFGALLLLAISVKDFALDWWTYSREWLVFVDAAWDVACYLIGWKMISSHAQLIADRAVDATERAKGAFKAISGKVFGGRK